ncbi:MAG: hypothetical protein M3317_17200 [Actinomycetota bacterium]|nr:hypothetical protein [Actinomycetota bacterium]
MANARSSEAESMPSLGDVRMSRRGFLSLSIAGIVGVPLLWAAGCGSSQDGGNGKKDKKGDGGGNGGGY